MKKPKEYTPGTTLSRERFEEMIQDLLSSFDPDWIGSHSYKQSFADKLARYVGIAERRGAANYRDASREPDGGES